MNFTSIPHDIRKIIFRFLEYIDLKNLCYVNKSTYKYVKNFNPKPFRKNQVYSLLDVVSIVDASTEEIVVYNVYGGIHIYKGHNIFLEKTEDINGKKYFVTGHLRVLVNEKSIKKAKSCFVEMITRVNNLTIKVDTSRGAYGFEVGDRIKTEKEDKGKIVGVTVDDEKLWMILDKDNNHISFLRFKDIDELSHL